MKFVPSGDKSEVLDVDSPDLEQFPQFVKAKRYECVLEPGDLLFIPGRCLHLILVLTKMMFLILSLSCVEKLMYFTTRFG